MKKWTICILSLVVLLCATIAFYTISKKDNTTPLPEPTVILYNNKYYQIKADTEITSNDVGGLICNLTTDKSNVYIPTTEKTEAALFEYSTPQKTSLLFKKGDNYQKVLFSNYAVDSSDCLDISFAFSVFSITEHSDIKKISQVKSNISTEVSGNVITDSEIISTFYNEISMLEKYSEDKYHQTELASTTSPEEYDKRTRNRRDLLIETTSGLSFYLECYPHFKWVYSPTTQTYYKMNDAFYQWSKDNLK